MIGILIYILVVCLIVGLIYWVIDQLFPAPHPFNKIVKVVVVVIGSILIILALLSLVGYDVGMPLMPRRTP